MVTSPDYKPYVDLTLNDRTPFELVQRGLTQLAANLPGWVQRVGNTEAALMEALALIVAEDGYAINRVTTATITGILGLMGYVPDVGAPPTSTATVHLADTFGHTVPAGTRLRLNLGAASLPTLDFLVTSDRVVAPGSSVATCSVQATVNTDLANNTPSGTPLIFVAGAPFITTITLAASIVGGRLPEDGPAFVTRASQGLQRSYALATPAQFTAAAVAHPAIFRALTISNWDGNPAHTVGAQPGFITVAVYGKGGATVASGVKAALLAQLQAGALVNLTIAVVDPTITTINVTATVFRTALLDAPTVQANVVAAVNAYLSTDTWPWGGTMKVDELEAVIDRAIGVDYVSSLTVPSGDVTLSGAAPLARAGTVAITVAN